MGLFDLDSTTAKFEVDSDIPLDDFYRQVILSRQMHEDYLRMFSILQEISCWDCDNRETYLQWVTEEHNVEGEFCAAVGLHQLLEVTIKSIVDFHNHTAYSSEMRAIGIFVGNLGWILSGWDNSGSSGDGGMFDMSDLEDFSPVLLMEMMREAMNFSLDLYVKNEEGMASYERPDKVNDAEATVYFQQVYKLLNLLEKWLGLREEDEISTQMPTLLASAN